MIENLKYMDREFEAENTEYTKIISEEKAFFIQNMVRAKKDGKPNVDELIILDPDNNAVDFDKEVLFHPDPNISRQH